MVVQPSVRCAGVRERVESRRLSIRLASANDLVAGYEVRALWSVSPFPFDIFIIGNDHGRESIYNSIADCRRRHYGAQRFVV